MQIISNSVEETEQIAADLAIHLPAGSIVAFTGDLGAGKTAFVRGMAKGLGITERVTSPTFTIVNEYEGEKGSLFHFDLYRLMDADELFDIGWEDYLCRNGICAVEWSERAPEFMENSISVDIKRGANDEQRIIEIKGIKK